MDAYQESCESWNKLAELYQEKFMDLDIYNGSYDIFCSLVKRNGARVADIGCGPGNVMRYLQLKRPDFLLEGTDLAPNMVALAARNIPTSSCKVMDARDLRDLGEGFDGIISGFCFPYLSEADIEKFISDAWSILNNDGVLYVSFVEGSIDQSGFKQRSNGDRIYFHNHSLSFITNTLSIVGFSELHVDHINYERSETECEVHTFVIAKKLTLGRG